MLSYFVLSFMLTLGLKELVVVNVSPYLLLQTASPGSSYTARDWHQQNGLLAGRTGYTHGAAPSGQALRKLLARAKV